MVVVEKLSKATDLVPVKSTCKKNYISSTFMKEIFRLHDMPKEIISDRDMKFTSSFWKSLMVGFDTKLLFNTAYHPQSNYGQRERVNQSLEDNVKDACDASA
jgi:hypothetical protein